MDLTLWDSSFDQATQERKNHTIDGLEDDFYFCHGLDAIEESALNEKCCVQVLRKLITKTDNEIVQLEEDLVILQSQLAWADEDWSQLCSIALREKIDCLDISIRSLKSETLKDEYDFGYSLQIHREPAETLHDILKTLLRHFSHQKDKQPLAIVVPHSSSNGEKPAIRQSKEITPRNSNSEISIRKPTKKSSTTSVLTLEDKEKASTAVVRHSFSSNATGCNGKNKLSNIASRITNEKEIVAQSCTERSIILVGKGTNTSVKPIDTTSNSTSDSSKEATEDSGPTPKLVKVPAVTPENIDTSNSFSKEDSTSPRRVKVQEATASGTTNTAADSLLELLYSRRGNTTMPRSKRNQVQKAKEPGPNSAPVSQKRRKIGSNSAVLEDTKALVKLQDDEASNSTAENVKTLHSPSLLNDLTIIELRAIAKQRGMTGFYRLRKAELAKTLGFKLNRGMRKGKGSEANVLRIMPGES